MTTTPERGLRVGYVPGVILTKWRTIWEDRFPHSPLTISALEENEARAALLDGAIDMCFVRLPIDVERLHLIKLYEEQPVVWVAKEHAIAAVDEVTLADLADEEVLTDASVVNIDRVVAEVAVLRVPLSVARSNNRRDLVHRPVIDAEPTTVGLAWPRDADDALIQEFVGVVRGRSENSSRSTKERAARNASTPKPQPKPQPKPPAKQQAKGRGGAQRPGGRGKRR